jgi:hypothetical protein
MVDHIYGRGPSLVPPERPHMFAKEVMMYVDYFEKLVNRCGFTPREMETLKEFYENLDMSMDFCVTVSKETPYEGENLASLRPIVDSQRERLQALNAEVQEKALVAVAVN